MCGGFSCSLFLIDWMLMISIFFFFQAEDGIRDYKVTGVQTCALPICPPRPRPLRDAEIAECRGGFHRRPLFRSGRGRGGRSGSAGAGGGAGFGGLLVDRERVGEGKGVEFGGRRVIKKKKSNIDGRLFL